MIFTNEGVLFQILPSTQLVRIVSPNTSNRPRDRGKRDTVVRFSANNATVLPSVCRQEKYSATENVQTKSDKVSNGANRLSGNTLTGRNHLYISYTFQLDNVNWACNDLPGLQLILSRVFGNPELSIGSSESDWLVSANEKSLLLRLTNRRRGCSLVIMTHLAWVLSPAQPVHCHSTIKFSPTFLASIESRQRELK